MPAAMNMEPSPILMKKILFGFMLLPTLSVAQTLSYQWPGPLGHSVVYPKWTDERFMGTRAEWHGATSVSGEGPEVRDLRMAGWNCEAGKAYLMMNVLAFEPLMLDSITVVHRHGQQGPKQLLITLSTSRGTEEHIIAETAIADEYGATRIALHGLMKPAADAEYAYVQLKVIPYGGAEGTWDISSLAVHASRPRTKHLERLTTIADVLADRTAFEPNATKADSIRLEH
jgi:hypothetical protein